MRRRVVRYRLKLHCAVTCHADNGLQASRNPIVFLWQSNDSFQCYRREYDGAECGSRTAAASTRAKEPKAEVALPPLWTLLMLRRVGRCKLKASQNAAWLNGRTAAGRACVHAETCPTPIYGRAGRAAAPARLQYPTSRLKPIGGSGAESGYQDAQQACAGTACHYLVGASVASAAVASASAGSTYALTAPALAMSSTASAETA